MHKFVLVKIFLTGHKRFVVFKNFCNTIKSLEYIDLESCR